MTSGSRIVPNRTILPLLKLRAERNIGWFKTLNYFIHKISLYTKMLGNLSTEKETSNKIERDKVPC